MANEEVGNLTVRIGMDNTGFQSGVANLNRQLKVVQSEFAVASSKLGSFGDSTDQLKAKSDSLTKQMEIQKQKVQVLQSAFDKSAESKGMDAKATQDLQIKLNKAVMELQKTETELKNTNTEIDRQSSFWTKLSKSAEETGNKLKATGEKMVGVGKTLSMALTVPLLAAGGASVKLASDLNESLNKVDVAFGKNAKKVEDWSNTTLKSFGISKGSALDMAALFGDMGTAMGQSTEEASKMSTSLVGLAGDLASFKNIGIDQAQDALKGIFTGEGEALKSLGVIMQDSTLEAYALATGQKKSYDEMTQAEKVALRYAFVMDATKNSQGDFARTSDGTANQMRIFSESLQELGASFGQYILPVITPLLTKLNEMVQAFGKLDEGTKKTILIFAGIIAAIAPVILILGNLMSAVGTIAATFAPAIAGAGGLSAALGAIVAPVAIVIASIVAFIAIFTSLYKHNEDFRNNVNGVWANVKDTISSVIENIKTIISVFVEIAHQIWNTHGEKIKAVLTSYLNIFMTIINTTLNIIKQVFNAFAALVQGDWNGFFNSLKNIAALMLNGIGAIFKSGLALIQNLFSLLKDIVLNIFSSLLNGITTKVGEIVSTIINGIQSALDWLSTIPDQMFKFGVNILQGLINGIESKLKSLKDSISNVASTVTNGVKKALNINSPSKVMIEMGGFVTEGLAIGIEDEKAKISRAMNSVTSLISSTKAFNTAQQNSINDKNNNSQRIISEPNQTINNHYAVTTNFPNATNKNEIKQALNEVFNGLSTKAIQYAYKR